MGKCYNTITVNAPVETVWGVLRDFQDMSWATGVVTKTEVVGETKGDQAGSKRVLNDAFHETLLTHDDHEMRLTYSIDDGPGAVSRDAVRRYVGEVRVLPITADGTTFVEWQSRYESADDDAVGALCNPVYRALLGALRSHFA